MKTEDFYYDLPEELIAQVPIKDRTASRLLVLDKKTGRTIDKHFYDIKDYLKKGDVLVINNTRVIPARLLGVRSDTQSPVELLLLKRIDDKHWETLARPGKKVREGRRMTFIPGELEAECEQVLEGGNRIIRFDFEGVWEEVLDKAGTVPLPPYIHEKLDDPERYQTVIANFDIAYRIRECGVKMQVSAGDLLGGLFNKCARAAKRLVHEGLADSIVTDAHTPQDYEDFRKATLKISR